MFFEADGPWGAYLARASFLSSGEGLPPGFVPWSDSYAVVDDAVVGQVSVRHELTESLARVGGHIGYSVRPAYRRHGCATTLLRAGLGIARDLGIERCGGVLDDVVDVPGCASRRRNWAPMK